MTLAPPREMIVYPFGLRIAFLTAFLLAATAAFAFQDEGLSEREALISSRFENLCRLREHGDPDFLAETKQLIAQHRHELSKCPKLTGSWENQIRALYADVFTQKDYPIPKAACTTYLIEEKIELVLGDMLDDCKTLSAKEFRLRWQRPSISKSPSIITELDKEGCVVFKNSSIKYCNPDLSRTQALKDHSLLNYPFRNPLLNYLTHGEAYTHQPYGPANCHGTAQSLLGNFLEDIIVTSIGDQTYAKDPTCFATAKAKWPEGITSTAAKNLAVNGGMVINLKHSDCSASDPFTVTHTIGSCIDGKIEDYIFVEKMCVHYWGDQLVKRRGYRKTSLREDWRKWVPGCVFTQNDHTISLLFQSEGFCYYYESTTPYGSSRINLIPCPEIATRFDHAWCPAKPFPLIPRK